MAFLENSSNLTLTSYLPSSRVSAATVDYSLRYPAVKGQPLGILLASSTNLPLQMSTSTGIDIVTTTSPTVYTAYIAPKVAITATGSVLVTALAMAGSGMTSTGMIVYLTNGACTGIPANAVYSNG